MDFAAFKASTADTSPPAALRGPLLALWHAEQGDWHRAHAIVQDDEGSAAAWVHAYLHRVEGDISNAGYWYRRAGKPASDLPLSQEWEAISMSLLGQV